MKSHVKAVLGRAAHVSGLRKQLMGNRGTIVLFHRVDDRLAGDPISCTVAEFRAFCSYFRRHFDVVSMDEMIRCVAAGANLRGKLAITFDDGYLDNVRSAAPILREHGLPATFYITTDFMGSTHTAWWDEGLGFHPGWMTWDDVRELRDQGFSIGGHTATHVDLGAVDVATARREIRACKARLEAELGQPAELFSYPYGGRDNIRADNLAEVRSAGFTSCVSAFGGFVAPRDDPFELLRDAISPWYTSPYQLGFELMMRPYRGAAGSNVAPARVASSA